MGSERDLLARIHQIAATCLAAANVVDPSELFSDMDEIWNLTRDAWEQVHGPSGDDGRDFTPPYEP